MATVISMKRALAPPMEGEIRESVCDSPSKRHRLFIQVHDQGGVDPFPSLGTPSTDSSSGRTMAPALAATLEKELEEEEASLKQTFRHRLAPLEVDEVGADPFLPSFTKSQSSPEAPSKPWEHEGTESPGTDTEDGRSQFLGFDDEEEHDRVRQLTAQLAVLGK